MHVYIDVYRKQVVDRLSKQNLVKKTQTIIIYLRVLLLNEVCHF